MNLKVTLNPKPYTLDFSSRVQGFRPPEHRGDSGNVEAAEPISLGFRVCLDAVGKLEAVPCISMDPHNPCYENLSTSLWNGILAQVQPETLNRKPYTHIHTHTYIYIYIHTSVCVSAYMHAT